MLSVIRLKVFGVFFCLALLPAAAVAQDDLGKARSLLDSMREIVEEVESFANETSDDAIKQTCVSGAHREMSDVIAAAEKALQEAMAQGAGAHARALSTVEASFATMQQLRTDMYDCVGSDELGSGGSASRAYDPVRSSRQRETVGIPALRPPAASATK